MISTPNAESHYRVGEIVSAGSGTSSIPDLDVIPSKYNSQVMSIWAKICVKSCVRSSGVGEALKDPQLSVEEL